MRGEQHLVEPIPIRQQYDARDRREKRICQSNSFVCTFFKKKKNQPPSLPSRQYFHLMVIDFKKRFGLIIMVGSFCTISNLGMISADHGIKQKLVTLPGLLAWDVDIST